jgi:hypothetical protein
MDIDTFKLKFEEIKAKGFVRSLRNGPTGVGHTLEQLLELNENNIALPDIDNIELKAHRANSNSLITLFTFNHKAWQMKPLDAIRKYGSFDKNGRQGLYYTMSQRPNSAGLFLHIDNTSIAVRHIDGNIIVCWSLKNLTERFIQKIPALLFVNALTEERDGKEYFHYNRAQIMRGTSPELLANQFMEEHIVVDLRLHDKGSMARNHGTGFRAYEANLPALFSEIKDI